MSAVTVQELLESGIHLGHRTSCWNPKMRPYIYGRRNNVHILNIRETLKGLITARRFLEQVAARGGEFLFVGTKRQAKDLVQAEAGRACAHYVHERWIGGMLTNHFTIRTRLERLSELERMDADGSLGAFSKKMQASLHREKVKIGRSLHGVRRMQRLPDAVIVIDARRERTAVLEANRVRVPVLCLLDSDCDPDLVDIVIPGNDDSIRAIRIVLRECADAILAGRGSFERKLADDAREREARAAAARAAEEAKAAAEAAASGAAPEPPKASAADLAGVAPGPAPEGPQA